MWGAFVAVQDDRVVGVALVEARRIRDRRRSGDDRHGPPCIRESREGLVDHRVVALSRRREGARARPRDGAGRRGLPTTSVRSGGSGRAMRGVELGERGRDSGSVAFPGVQESRPRSALSSRARPRRRCRRHRPACEASSRVAACVCPEPTVTRFRASAVFRELETFTWTELDVAVLPLVSRATAVSV